MRKILGFTLVLTLVLGVSLAYACGEKKSSAEATKAGAEVSKANSAYCSAGKAAISTASAEKAVSVDIKAIDSKANNLGASVQKANVIKMSPGRCVKGSSVNTQKASAKGSDSCQRLSVKDSAEKKDTKAPKVSVSKSKGMASTAKTLTEEAGSLK